jgi:V/A-type H+/Na+-transporting ATPase subunit B
MIAYKSLETLRGPLVFVEKTANIGYQELVTITDPTGKTYQGQVIALEKDVAVVQLFSNSAGLQLKGSNAQFAGETKRFPLSPSLLGRVFNGYGTPIDSKGKIEDILPLEYRDINGAALNPFRRSEPRSFIQTGISAIDVSNTLVKGQKLPIFSGAGLPDLEMLALMAANSKTLDADDNFTVVVAAMGITNDQFEYIKSELDKTGALARSVMFVNLASDPVVERVLTPRLALTVSEYLAYDLGFSVLTLMFDMTNYADALREISAAKQEIPGRAGYPGYMYTDLASLYERAGTVEGKKGSITQVPILTMPNDDQTHPIPDLTGYITEGQITLSRDIHKKGVYPPIDILKSLSRLKDAGQGTTRDDHAAVADQMFACLAESIRQKDLAAILGEDSLTDTGRAYLVFNEAYYRDFLHQDGPRTIQESLDICWELFALLPREELKKLKDPLIAKYSSKIVL